VFLDPHGLVQQKWQFLRQKGMSNDQILEALNTATGGEVVRAAGLETLPSEKSSARTAWIRSERYPNRGAL
jgi:hypothetical protein